MTHSVPIPFPYKLTTCDDLIASTLSSRLIQTFSKVNTMSSSFIFPSYFESPLTTDIPDSRYDSKGRQLSFVESEVQRLERMALVNASKSRSSSPAQSSKQPSSLSRTKLIADPKDPIEFMANRLAEEYFHLSDEKLQIPYPIPESSLVPTSHKPSSISKPGYKRRRSSLSSICEED